jgi:hypothetical protein
LTGGGWLGSDRFSVFEALDFLGCEEDASSEWFFVLVGPFVDFMSNPWVNLVVFVFRIGGF